MNIVLVVFDSLRKDSISANGQPPWGRVQTPHLDALMEESLVMTRAYPEALPTLPARRAIYTGRRVYPFHNADFRLKGDFVGAPGWGPIPEDQPTLAEMLSEAGYRTGLIADVYHMFKPSKNYWRGFHQWTFLRGQEKDPSRSGPEPSREMIDKYVPRDLQKPGRMEFIRTMLKNMYGRTKEEDYFNARVFIEASRWLEQNRDADKFFLTVESFDPHEPWFVPEHYRNMYLDRDLPQQVMSGYQVTEGWPQEYLISTQANYSGLVTMCDRWFGHFYETMKALGLLDNTLLIVTSDHGHSIGDRNYIGKRGYPSAPEVFDIPMIIRHPEGAGAGRQSDVFVQHHDLSATIMELAEVEPSEPLDGRSFWKAAIGGDKPIRDHVTIAWGSAVTVMDGNWWLNCKVNGKGAFLHDLSEPDPFAENEADRHPEIVNQLFEKAVSDAEGGFPEYLIRLAESQKDAPGCSAIAARSV